jgi:hypothetical protein
MGAIDNFLKRWGYAKLDRYGLLLTAEDRVLSTRPAVLDDGLGSKIVGWIDGDLAAMELERWGASRPAAAKPVAATPKLQSQPVRRPSPTTPPRPVQAPAIASPPPAQPAQPVPAAPAVAPRSSVLVAPPPPVLVKPAAVSAAVEAGPPVEEDEWEWEIAMARARAAADEVQLAVSSITPRAGNKTEPMIAADPMASWPATEPLGETWGDVSEPAAPRVLSPVSKTLLVDKRLPAQPAPSSRPAATPAARAGARTVIPVPSLPVAARPQDVRPAAHTPSEPLRSRPAPARTRLARGTSEETVQTHRPPTSPPANDDTSPYVTLPAEVKPTGSTHGRRVAAKHL